MSKTVSIITNNLECDELSSYYAKIEKYFLLNGWKTVKSFDSDLTIIIACGTVDLMFERTKNMLTDIFLKKGNFNSTIIMGCQTITYRKKLEEIFNGRMISYKEEHLLDDLINANFKFSSVNPPNVFNSPKQAKNNDKNKLFTIVISSGCLMKCTYCIIKKAHGFIRSKTIDQISKEFSLAVSKGYKHIALGGTDTSAYGYDSGTDIITLIKTLRAINSDVKFYIANLHPVRLSRHYEDFINLAKEKAFAYLQIPFQHVNNEILKHMGRETDFEKIYSMVKQMKLICPEMILFTDFICGFPGETEEQYSELYDFIKNDNCFDYYYINEYCGIEKTDSYTYPNQIADEVKHQRYENLIRNFEQRKAEKLKSLDKETYDRIRHRYDIHNELDKENNKGYYFCSNSFDEII